MARGQANYQRHIYIHIRRKHNSIQVQRQLNIGSLSDEIMYSGIQGLFVICCVVINTVVKQPLPHLNFHLLHLIPSWPRTLSFHQPGKTLLPSSLATLAAGGFLFVPPSTPPQDTSAPVQGPPGARGARLHTVGPQSVLQL